MARPKKTRKKTVDAFRYEDANRKNLPSAEHQPLMQDAEQSPVQLAYARRNRDLDPQLVWRGKDEQDWSDLVVNAPPLYIQERVHPKVLVDDLMRQSQQARRSEDDNIQPGFADLFADFNGLPSEEAKTEFYQHDANWSNRMILGDSLQVMASLAEREGCAAKCSASTSTRPTASSSTPTSNGPPPAAPCKTIKPTTSPASRSRSRPSATPGATASTPT